MLNYPDSPLKRTLVSALKHVHHVCIFGATNKISDYYRTNNHVSYVESRNRAGTYVQSDDKAWAFKPSQKWSWEHIKLARRDDVSPLYDEKFYLTNTQHNHMVLALIANANRYGNCHDQSAVVAKFLWENSDHIDKIEIVAANSFDHAFVIVNRRGDLAKPETWGDAWIIDSWYESDHAEGVRGFIYHASEFKETLLKVKAFAKTQLDFLKTMNRKASFERYQENEDTTCTLLCEINPKINPYPTYTKALSLNDYYEVAFDSEHFFAEKNQYNLYQASHKKKFSSCLKAIKKQGQGFGRVGFFQPKQKLTEALPAKKTEKGCICF